MADFVVTNGNDSGTGSLRQAILDANASFGVDTITVTEDVTLTSAINITDSVTIVGVGSTVITQTRSDRLFTIDDGDSTKISEVSFTDINLTGGNSSGDGGAIFSQEDLSIINSNLFDNFSGYYGGAIHIESAILKLDRTNITDNVSFISGAGINASNGSQVEISNSTITDNVSQYGEGGAIGITDNSQVKTTNSTIASNASRRGGGIDLAYNSSLKILNSSITDNKADEGGAISAITSQVEISNSTISGNIAERNGGGINVRDNSFLKLADSSVDKNLADGGGINVRDNSQAEIFNSTITGNTSEFDGGGINVRDNSALKLSDSLVADNAAYFAGGGVHINDNSQVEISNSTITGNTVELADGGGINIGDNSALKLSDSLVADNLAVFLGDNINVYESSQVEILNSTITGHALLNGDSGISSYDSTVTIIDSNVNNSNNFYDEGITELVTLRLEAEDLTEVTNYRLEDNVIASNGQLLSLRGGEENEVGTASFDFTGVSGKYTVKIGTYDENDGEATIQLTQKDDLIGSIVLDDNPGGFAVSADTKVTRVAATDILIEQGDRFTITGLENASEHARIDFIEFEPVGSLEPIPTKPIRLEAEDADSLTNYRLEQNRYASGDEVLSLKGGTRDEVGSASFTFKEQGTYDIVLGTFDENDGTATITLELNGSQIGETILLDEDLGRNLGDSYTAVSKNIAFGISLEAGDVLTINGFEQGGEFARIDYLEFIATDSF